jgi:hypothetical protein
MGEYFLFCMAQDYCRTNHSMEGDKLRESKQGCFKHQSIAFVTLARGKVKGKERTYTGRLLR